MSMYVCSMYVCMYVYECVQCGHLIPAPVDRASASAGLCIHQWKTGKTNKARASMTHVAC